MFPRRNLLDHPLSAQGLRVDVHMVLQSYLTFLSPISHLIQLGHKVEDKRTAQLMRSEDLS
jgi:hypothetical protein